MTNEHPSDDERVETDGGTAETPDATANTSDATAEVENENRSLSDLPLSRRTTLALSSTMAVGAGASGAASATDVEVGDPAEGDGFVSPGADTRVLDLTLDSEDSVIDIDGGSGLDESAESLYSTVTDDHPTPSPDQEIIPGDLISEFSTQDRVFTDAYETFSEGDDSYFDIDNDSLFQAAGFTSDKTDHPGDYIDTRYVDEFIPFGYTASDGDGNGCVIRTTFDNSGGNLPPIEVNQNGTLVEEQVGTTSGEKVNTYDINYSLSDNSGATSVEIVRIDISNNDGVGVAPGDVTVAGNSPNDVSASGAPPRAGTISDGTLELSFAGNPIDLSSASDPFFIEIDNLPNDPAPIDRSPEFVDASQGEIVALPIIGKNADSSSNQSATALPFEGGHSTDISDVINPQLSVKVDSIGIGQDPATAADTDPEADVFTTPGGALKPDVPGNGFVDDPPSDQVSFVDHKQDVTLPNSGRLTAVKDCTTPRGDVQKCVAGEAATTSGHRDLSQVGLQDDFDSLSDGSFVLISGDAGDVDERTGSTTSTPFSEAVVLSDNFETDEPALNNNTGYADFVSVFDVDGEELAGDVDGEELAGTELRRVSQTSQASEVVSPIKRLARTNSDGSISNSDLARNDLSTSGALASGGIVNTGSNGFVQLPLNPTEEPDFTFERGDALQTSEQEEEMLARGAVEDLTAIATLAESDGNTAVITESEAYRELELVNSDAYVPKATGSDAPAAFIDSNNDFVTPVQIFVAGRFDCPDSTPFDMGNVQSVDITRSDRVSFEVTNGTSEVDDATGIFYPSSNDNGAVTVEVTVERDDTVATHTVDIEVYGAPELVNVPNTNDAELVDLRDIGGTDDGSFEGGVDATAGSPFDGGNLPAGMLNPLPAGESMPASLVTTVETDTQGTFTIELTNQVAPDGSSTTTVNSDDSATVTVSSVAAGESSFAGSDSVDGLALELGTPGANGQHPDDGGDFDTFRETANITAESELYSWNSSAGQMTVVSDVADDTRPYTVEGNYVLRAAARPSTGRPAATYEIDTDDVILVELTDNTGDDGVVNNAFLNDPETIAEALENAINDATREGANVEVLYDPDFHSAFGYVVRSTTPVESSFDQNVAVSSVEIGSFVEIVENDSGTFFPNDNGSATILLSDIDFDPYEDDPTVRGSYYERQDIPRALGLSDRAAQETFFNEVNAKTVENDNNKFTDELTGPTFDPDDADRYAARADPFDQVDVVENNEFLGDNELTGNELALGAALELVGAEDPEDPSESESGLHQRNPRVLAYYDSQISAVLEAKGGTGVETEFGGANTLTQSPTRRPGAPNVEEGAFRDFVHNSEPVYNAVEDEAGTTFATDEYPRVRFRMALPNSGTVNFEVPIFGGVSDGTQNPSVFQPLPFYEGFDVIEVGDGITSAADPGVPPTLERDVEQSQDVNRGLGPENTAVQNFYGDRFDGLAIRNAGSVDLDDVREHVLRANEDISRSFIQAGQPIDIAGQDRAPLFPQSRPDLAVFYGLTDLDSNDALVSLQGRGSVVTFSPDPSQMDGADEYRHFLFTDDQGEELYFGAGSDDDDTTTTDGDDIADSVQLVANAAVSTDVAQGETLQYEVGQLYDHDTNGDYDAVRPGADDSEVSASFQDRGIFFESHDDDGNLAVDVGEVIVDPAAGGGSFDPLEEYDDDGSGDIEANELLNAIDDWRNENIEVGELLQVIDEWRN